MTQQPKPVVKLGLKPLDLGELVRADELLARAPLFRATGPDDAAKLLATGIARKVVAGVAIFQAGQPGDSLYFVLKGEVLLTRGAGAQTVEVGTARAGDFFGEAEVLAPTGKRGCDAKANGEVQFAELPRGELAAVMARRPEVKKLLEQVHAQRNKANDELASFLDRW